MNKRQLNNIIHSHFIRLKKYSRQISKTGSEQAIHHFRVEVKKLRALLRLLSVNNQNKTQLKLPGSIKKMYRFVGQIRDEQLHQQRLGVNHSINIHRTSLSTHEGWKKYILTDEKLNREEAKIVKLLPLQLNEQMLQHFFSIKKKKIYTVILNNAFTDKNLHTIRKALKDLIYISRLLHQQHTVSGYIFRQRIDLKKAETLAQSLGIFNDICTALSRLSLPASTDMEEKEKLQVKSYRRRWMTAKRNRKKTLARRLEKFKDEVLSGYE